MVHKMVSATGFSIDYLRCSWLRHGYLLTFIVDFYTCACPMALRRPSITCACPMALRRLPVHLRPTRQGGNRGMAQYGIVFPDYNTFGLWPMLSWLLGLTLVRSPELLCHTTTDRRAATTSSSPSSSSLYGAAHTHGFARASYYLD